MADSATPPAAASAPAPASTNANGNSNDKKPTGGGNRGNNRGKRNPSRQTSVNNAGANGNAPKDNTSGNSGNASANAAAKGPAQPRPQRKGTANGGNSPAPVPQVAAAVASDASRPSSTDGTKKNDNRRNNGPRRDSQSGGRGQGNNRRGSGRSASQSQSRQQSGDQAKASPSSENPALSPAQETGPAQRLLERAITDMRALPAAQSAPQPQNAPVAPQQAPSSQGSTLGLNAPVFQPGASVYPTPGAPTDLPPRHRKSASTGSHSSPGSFNSPSFASPLQNFSPNLHSMREDAAEEGEIDENGNPYPQQPQFQQRNAQPPVGAFSAPRFAALAQQQQPQAMPANQEESEVIGPSGRPQLAPSFQFGARRRTNTNGPALPEDDLGFQFPQQQHYQPESQQQQPQAHRRTGSEVTGMLAEQMALQAQIEALQQQQQQLLQQQIATGGVMSTFANAASIGAGRPMQNHRRIQSQQIPVGGGMGSFGGMQGGTMGNFGAGMGLNNGVGLGLPAEQNPNAPRGHGRRHSVNVINKSPGGGETLGQFNYPYNQANEGYEDGFAPPPSGHNRQASRSDASWRINGGAGAIGNNFGQGAAELAQAQAQLQSLQQFRAAAGGHHQKMPSFSFPNMLPNMMAANMMSFGGGLNVLQQQQQQFQMQLQQQSNQPQRKSLFAPYLPQASLPPLLAAGKLVVGILRVNKRNRSDAYVSTEVLDADIYICGSKDRNRALEGDIVAVELLDVDEVWGTKKEKEEKKRKKEENAAYDNRGAIGRKNDKKKDDVEVEGQGLMLFEDEEVTDEVKPQFAGHVVAVVERMPGQLFSGTLGLLRPSSAATKEKQEAERREREGDRYDEQAAKKEMERPKIVWFKPTDKRVPLIAIPTEQAPPDFVTNSEAYADKLFVACIKRHPISSLHPFGTLVEELGPIGDVEVETSALLKDCNFPTEEFTDNVVKCLPPLPWSIPEREYETRRDFRNERVFTIDPATAKDMDDALHIQVNDDGTYDVGVHITDVSYFVKPNTALDRDARKRATSVYLVQRAVPMLPPILSEELCSLVPGKERLAFSAVFTMTQDARIIKKWFGRSIIKSAAKLSYPEAQVVIDGGNLVSENIDPQHSANAIEGDIKTLHSLAKQMRDRRIENGTLSIQSLRLKFDLDEAGAPLDCSDERQAEANYLVAEFMILANTAVAQQIAVHLPEQALLRRHEEPIERRLAGFKERAARLGYEVDTSSAGALQKSFNAIEDPIARRILEVLGSKAMHRAKYFCSGMLDIAKYGHYALAEPLYTHFTSPIRRYADILVHRQLESVVSPGSDVKFTMDRDSVAKVAQQCNIKKDSAKLAQEQSAHLFLCLLISDLTQKYGPVVRQARVVSVLDAAFDVLIPEFGIEKRVHVDQMPIDNHVFEEHTHTLQIYWSTRDVITWLAENSDDEHLKKVKQTAEQHAVKMELTSRSVHDESALFDEDEEDEIVINRPTPQAETEAEETSKQRKLSKAKVAPQFEGLRRTAAGHRIQDIRELMSVPVIVTADLTKSPPVIKVYSVNPYADAAPAPAKK